MTPAITRLMILIAVFAMVFLASEMLIRLARKQYGKSSAINRRLQMIEGGIDRELVTSHLRKSQSSRFAQSDSWVGKMLDKVERMVIASGIKFPAHQVMIAMVVSATLATGLILIGAAIAGFGLGIGLIQLALALGVCFGIGIPLMVISQMAAKRRQKMQEQFPVALDVFVRGLKSGHPISSALDLLTKEMEDPIGSEFGLVVDEVSYGADLKDALQAMADRWDMDDIQMFVVSLSVQNETGGNLAEILTNLSRVIRERAGMLLKVRALSSEGRMTAVILTGLPIMSFTMLFMINPGFYLKVSQDPIFVYGFGGLMVLYAIGFYTIRRLVDLKV